jgi:hypothetical protein
VKGTLLCNLVPAVVDALGNAFPELAKESRTVANVIREEEEAFLKTLDRGIELFEDAAKRAKDKVISARTPSNSTTPTASPSTSRASWPRNAACASMKSASTS